MHASVTLHVQWDVNCVSVFGFQGRSQASQREGSAPWESTCVSRAYLLAHRDFVHMPPSSTALCFGPRCGVKATSTIGRWFAAGSDQLRGFPSHFKPQRTSFPLLPKLQCSQPMGPIYQFPGNLILVTQDKYIHVFEKA